MFWLLLVVLVIAMIVSVVVRVIVTHPGHAISYSVLDLANYLKYKKWRLCNTGYIIGFVGLFGKGKTLSAVHYVTSLYYRFNDRKVYDSYRKKWVIQKVHVVSNVDISIPYEHFIGLMQMVQIPERYAAIDEENNTMTIHLFLGDEFSVQLNSRSFKTNIDPLFLNTLLTCRHHHISLIYTAQRFQHVDALLRQVTSYVVNCNKVWRVMVHGQYDAYELENTANILDVKPIRRYGWFILNKDFAAYDTLACVQNLSRSCTSGDMLTEEQILALQRNTEVDADAVSRPSRRFVNRMKKYRK